MSLSWTFRQSGLSRLPRREGLVLERNAHRIVVCAIGLKNGAMIGVNIGTLLLIEIVTISPGPPALPAPPATL